MQAAYSDKRIVLHKSHLIEPIIRHRIQDSIFYKQHLYLTNEATILPVITESVHYIAGTDSVGRPSPYLCCLLRLLELEPSQEILDAYITQLGYNEFKYLTALILHYVRLVFPSGYVYNQFDAYYEDYRKLRIKLKSPEFDSNSMPIHYKLTYMDQWVDELVTQERVVDIILPRLVPRQLLVQKGEVQPRKYYVDEKEDLKNTQSDKSESESDYQSDSD